MFRWDIVVPTIVKSDTVDELDRLESKYRSNVVSCVCVCVCVDIRVS